MRVGGSNGYPPLQMFHTLFISFLMSRRFHLRLFKYVMIFFFYSTSRKTCCWPAKQKEPPSSWLISDWPLKSRESSRPGLVSPLLLPCLYSATRRGSSAGIDLLTRLQWGNKRETMNNFADYQQLWTDIWLVMIGRLCFWTASNTQGRKKKKNQ